VFLSVFVDTVTFLLREAAAAVLFEEELTWRSVTMSADAADAAGVVAASSDEICVLCQEAFDDRDHRQALHCMHYFHEECLSDLMRAENKNLHNVRCPKCKCNRVDFDLDNVGVQPLFIGAHAPVVIDNPDDMADPGDEASEADLDEVSEAETADPCDSEAETAPPTTTSLAQTRRTGATMTTMTTMLQRKLCQRQQQGWQRKQKWRQHRRWLVHPRREGKQEHRHRKLLQRCRKLS